MPNAALPETGPCTNMHLPWAIFGYLSPLFSINAMTSAWFKMHSHVDKTGDNAANHEYRCPHCNRLDFRTEQQCEDHVESCDRRETHKVSRQLVRKVRLARQEEALSKKQRIKIGKKTVPRKLKVKYLGSWISHDGSSLDEVRYRIAKARKKFNSMYTLWKSKRLSKSRKCKLYTGVLAR